MNKQLTNLQKPLPLEKKHLSKIFGIALLFLALNFSSVAANVKMLSEKVQLRVENVSIKDALKEIERQCEFTFLYNDASINVNQTITVSSKEQTVEELLDKILKNNGINYTIIDNQIVLTKAAGKQADKKIIKGKISDSETSEGLPGVTILEKGTGNGTVSDLNGDFTITVAENATIVLSYVGYVTEEIQVQNRTDFNMALVPDIISLGDVVVIGYGTVKKSDLTGAVASISADQLHQTATAGLDQAIQGRTAGVSVTTNSGTPGAAPTVRIRGVGTVTNPDPFFVIDGMPVSAGAVGSLNPGDIESMEILKDASAAAIYGARAANGVVLITTKKGKEGKSTVSFDAYTGVQSVAKKYELMDAQNFVTIRNMAGNDWEDSSLVKNTDWQDEIFRKAKISDYQLSFLGGAEKMRYALIGDYFNQEGIVKGTDYERYSIRLNTSLQVKPWLGIGENVSFIHSTQNRVPEQDEYSSVVVQALVMDPATPVYNSDSVPSASQRNNISNPVGLIERNHNVTKTDKLVGNAYIEIKPVPWLGYKATIGTEYTRAENEQYFPVFHESDALQNVITQLYRGYFNTSTLLMEHLLTFNKTFADKHDLQILAGYTRQENVYRMQLSYAQGIPENPDLWFMSNATDPLTNRFEDISANFYGIRINQPVPTDASLVSWLGRFIYSYSDRYELTASFRRDGSSKFGSESRWGNFPSFAAGWKISQEPFFQNVPVISFLKIRGGWGKLGNQEIQDYQAFSSISTGMNATWGLYPDQATYPGGAPRGYGNKEVHWEETVQANFGLDLNLIDNKFSLNFDYFIKNTNDMLLPVPIADITGIELDPTVNIGSVSNKGFEINATFKEKRGDFSYDIGANFSRIKNEVTDLGGEDAFIQSAQFRATNYISRTEVGQPIASFYGFVTDGYWQNQTEIDEANAAAIIASGDNRAFYDLGTTSPGDIKFKDINNDGRITIDDRTFIGSPHPDFTYGINIDLAYKMFDFKIFGQGVYGNEVFQATLWYLESPNGYWNMLTSMNDNWTTEGDNTAVPRLDFENSNDNLRFSDRYVKDGSYFRIKSMQLGVSLPETICKKIRVERLRIYLAGQNLLSFHKYTGFDPEIGSGNSQGNDLSRSGALDIGIDRGMYPIARTISVGMNLTF